MPYKILIADDEKELVQLLALYLEKDGNKVFSAYDGESACKIASSEQLDCVLLDVMMPSLNGFQVLKKIRETSDIPVLFLTAKVASSDKILGLDLGADDYITKPFDPVEVVARVNANIRRYRKSFATEAKESEKISCGKLTLNLGDYTLFEGEKKIEITALEFRILKMMFASPRQVFTKSQIVEAGWGKDFYVEDNNIMVALSKLRSKLGESCTIKNIRSIGWRLEQK